MLKNKVNISDSGYGSSLDTGKDVDDDIELVLQENSSGDTCKSFWSYGAGLSVYRVVQWVYQIVRRTKVARILSHIDAVPENEIEDTIKEVAKELSVAYEYQLMVLYGEEEVIRLADHAVCCLMTYLNSSDSTFSCSSLLQAAIEVISLFHCYTQGCGNTMPDLSDLVPFHSGQVENFYLLVLGQVQMYKNVLSQYNSVFLIITSLH